MQRPVSVKRLCLQWQPAPQSEPEEMDGAEEYLADGANGEPLFAVAATWESWPVEPARRVARWDGPTQLDWSTAKGQSISLPPD